MGKKPLIFSLAGGGGTKKGRQRHSRKLMQFGLKPKQKHLKKKNGKKGECSQRDTTPTQQSGSETQLQTHNGSCENMYNHQFPVSSCRLKHVHKPRVTDGNRRAKRPPGCSGVLGGPRGSQDKETPPKAPEAPRGLFACFGF